MKLQSSETSSRTYTVVLVYLFLLDALVVYGATTTRPTATKSTTRATTRATNATRLIVSTTVSTAATTTPSTAYYQNYTCEQDGTVEITTDTGFILSPNYPQRYGYQKWCLWRIRLSSMSKWLRFTSLTFDTESCCDGVIIKPLTNGQALLGSFTGSAIIDFVLKDYAAEVTFSADESIDGLGFQIKFEPVDSPSTTQAPTTKTAATTTPIVTTVPTTTTTVPQVLTPNFPCIPSGTVDITTDTGYISSPNYPRAYGYQQNCVWKIQFATARRMRFSSPAFETEQFSDYVMISVGSPARVALGPFSGNSFADTLAFASSVEISFISDESINAKGFQIRFESLDSATTAPIPTTSSPATSKTTSRVAASTTAVSSTGRVSTVTTISRTSSAAASTTGSVTLTTTKVVSTTGSVTTASTTTATTTATGTAGVEYPCNLTDWVMITAYSGYISSPNYPRQYGNFQRCFWRVQLNNTNMMLRFTSSSFNTEAGYDKLYIRPLTNGQDILGPFSGRTFAPLIVDDYAVDIYFSSDSSINSTGFLIAFYAASRSTTTTSVPVTTSVEATSPTTVSVPAVTCSQNTALNSSAIAEAPTYPCDITRSVMVTSETGYLTSPNFPNLYGNNQQCNWTIFVNKAQTIRFSSYNMDVESGLSGCKDSITMRPVESNVAAIGPFCGTKPFTGCVPARAVNVTFTSDGFIQRTGFRIGFKAEN